MSTKKLYSTVNRIENAIKFRSLSLPPSVPIKAFVFKEATSKPKRGAQGWTASGKQKNKGIGNGILIPLWKAIMSVETNETMDEKIRLFFVDKNKPSPKNRKNL